MKIKFRGRIKDLLIREGPNKLPQMSQQEAEEYYAKGFNRDSIIEIEKEFEDISEPQTTKEDKKKFEVEDFTKKTHPKEDKKKLDTEDFILR